MGHSDDGRVARDQRAVRAGRGCCDVLLAVRVPAVAGVRRLLRELRRRRERVGVRSGSPRDRGRSRRARDVRATRGCHRPNRVLDALEYHRLRDARRCASRRLRTARCRRSSTVDVDPAPAASRWRTRLRCLRRGVRPRRCGLRRAGVPRRRRPRDCAADGDRGARRRRLRRYRRRPDGRDDGRDRRRT